ncbi:MAG: hypothetical protein AABY22_25125, partial [Nanoarchaeota archaeon]
RIKKMNKKMAILGATIIFFTGAILGLAIGNIYVGKYRALTFEVQADAWQKCREIIDNNFLSTNQSSGR